MNRAIDVTNQKWKYSNNVNVRYEQFFFEIDYFSTMTHYQFDPDEC